MCNSKKDIFSRQTFSKEERLCRKSYIDNLFAKGKSIKSYPLRLIWAEGNASEEMPVQVIIAASKKLFKKAYQRNHVKRLLREAYRKNKGKLYQTLVDNNIKLSLAIFCLDKKQSDYHQIEEKMQELLEKLEQQIIPEKKE